MTYLDFSKNNIIPQIADSTNCCEFQHLIESFFSKMKQPTINMCFLLGMDMLFLAKLFVLSVHLSVCLSVNISVSGL